MRKWGKALACMLVLALAVALVGCGKQGGGNAGGDTGKTEGGTGKTDTGKADGGSQEEGGTDYSEHYTYSMASVQVNESTDYNGDEFAKWWEETYNFDWDIISIPMDNWAEKVRIWINSGDLPDVTIFNYNHGEMLNYIDQELVFRFPDGWQERWPNVAKTQEDSQLGARVAESVGGTYFLARPAFANNKPTEKNVTIATAYLRKDWAEAVGFELKDSYTMSEFLEYARLIKEKDPGNVGSKLVPIAVNSGNASQLFVARNSTWGYSADSMFYRGEDGKFKWGPADEDTLRGLSQWSQAYDEGLLNPEFYTYTGSEDVEDFYVGGTAGACWYQCNARYIEMMESNVTNNLGVSGKDAVWQCVITADDGHYYDSPSTNFFGTIIFNPDIDMKKWERYMDMLDYSATDEGQYFIRLGFEGTDWERDADGEIQSLLPEGTDARSKYPSIYPIFHQLLILSDDFVMINPNYSKEARDRALEIYKVKEALSSDTSVQDVDYNVYFYSSEAKNALSFDLNSEYASLVTSGKDIETAWKEWVDSYAYLINPVLEEMNENIQ